jgi:hypothetical protein
LSKVQSRKEEVLVTKRAWVMLAIIVVIIVVVVAIRFT